MLLLLGAATGAPAASAAGLPAQQACAGVAAPGPAVDSLGGAEPGGSAPAPLPVPAHPVGGDAMGTCGTVVPSGAPAPPEVGVQSYVVADLDSGQVLAARVPHARLRPASLLKTLTGLLIAQDLPMDQTVVGTQDDANQEGTRVGIGPGGQYTIRQLLDGMLMASGNDIAHALSIRLTGSVPATVDLMNRTAARIGALDTRAATPSGLDGPGQSSSAYDLASIFRLGMQHEPFATAVGTTQIILPGLGPEPAVRRGQRQQAPRPLPGRARRQDRVHRRRAAHLHRGGAARRSPPRRRPHARRAAPGADVRAGDRVARLRLLAAARGLGRAADAAGPRHAPRGDALTCGRGLVHRWGASPATGRTNWQAPVAIGAVVVLGLVVLAARLRRRRG